MTKLLSLEMHREIRRIKREMSVLKYSESDIEEEVERIRKRYENKNKQDRNDKEKGS